MSIAEAASVSVEQVTTDEIYLDNGATTRMAPAVLETMLPWMKAANPSSLHAAGGEARRAVEKARAVIAGSIGAHPNEIIFTSGGSEANNLALKGYAFANRHKGNHIITTSIEHKSVCKTCAWLEEQGFEITLLPVDEEGFVDPKAVEAAIKKETILVSVIHANNEVGTIQDLETIGGICKRHGVPLHTDACQSYTKMPIDVEQLSMVTINAHKIHGPKGVGALYVKSGVQLTPLVHGGEHERGRRAGTENVASIVGFAKAATLNPAGEMEALRDKLIQEILRIPGTRLNGPRTNRLCNNVNVSFERVEGEAIVGRLDTAGIRCSTGSACSEATLEPSYVLKAIGLTDEEANGSLRLSLSKDTTSADVERVIDVLPGIIEELRELSPIGR